MRPQSRARWQNLPTRSTLAVEHMPTRNVVLTQRHEQLIDVLVRSGRYQNASEVLREGLRLIEEREAMEAAQRAALREAAAIGLTDLERGAYREFADPVELRAHLERVAEDVLHGE